MPLLLSFLLFSIFPSYQAKETIRFQAAKTPILRDVKHGLHFANFVKHKSKYMNASPFMSLLVPNEKKCQVSCVKDMQCLSINVAVFPNSDGQYKCELLATHRFNSSINMTDSVNYHHYSIQSACEDNKTCNPPAGSCHPHYSNNSYWCKCLCPYYGEQCQKAIVTTSWSAWSECRDNGSICANFTLTRNRTRRHSHPELVSSVCPDRDNAIQKEQICTQHTMVPQGCDGPLGMEDGRITNAQLSASSLTYHWWPHHTRLNQYIGHYGSWMPDMNRAPPHYLAIDLATVMHITKVATQGTPHSSPYYVTRYSLQYSTDNTNWTDYYNSRCIKILPGNTNPTNEVVTNTLNPPFKARYVRIIVKEYNEKPAMRVELYGCPA